MTHLFISHSSRDGAAIAQPLCAALESAGHRCWIAPRDVKPGEPYSGQIIGAIRSCVGLILIVTPDANESRDVLREVQRASTERKIIAPIVVDQTTLVDDLDYYVAVLHQIPWSDAASTAQALLRTFPVPIPTANLAPEFETESAEELFSRLQITTAEARDLQRKLDASLDGLEIGRNVGAAKRKESERSRQTRAHDLLGLLRLQIVSGGPSNRYPRGMPGPAKGFRFWATHLATDGVVQFGAQRTNGVFGVEDLTKLQLVGFKARKNGREIFIEIDESLDDKAMSRAEHAVRELRHLLNRESS